MEWTTGRFSTLFYARISKLLTVDDGERSALNWTTMRASYYHIKLFIKKRWGVAIIVFLMSSFACAQKISVSRFVLAESDLTAQNKGTMVEDQNGDKCALIRIQTTQKGFSFDVGSAGVQKIDDNHVGEIWVYVPYGVRHISIRHPQLGSLANYDFPINIEKARTYIMEISSDKIFVNYYDDTRKQKLHIRINPSNSTFTLNGMNVTLDSKGEATQDLSFGTYTYKVVADKYYPKEGQIVINDSTNVQQLIVNDLKAIKGKLSVHTNPYNAEVMIDGVTIPSNTALTPHSLQIGHHKLLVKSNGYKLEEQDIEIKQDETLNVSVTLSKVAMFSFTSTPTGAMMFINGERLSNTPCKKELKTGSYEICAQKVGYKDYMKKIELNSSNPNVNIELSKIYNYKNEFYAEVGTRAGSYMAFGGSIGGYISNVNIELSAFYGTGNSETVYWSGNDTKPVSSVYHPQMTISGKVGYGVAIGTRFRITPQIGLNYLKLEETMQEGTSITPAQGANVISGLVGVRFSAIITNHFGVSLSPEYSFGVSKSNGYKELEAVSSKVKNWGQGFNVKLGLMVAF